MSVTLNLELPESLDRAARELANREGISMEQLAIIALTKMVDAIRELDYMRERATRGRLEDFERILSLVSDVEPEPYDRLPPSAPPSR